jgi:hypothetical protein
MPTLPRPPALLPLVVPASCLVLADTCPDDPDGPADPTHLASPRLMSGGEPYSAKSPPHSPTGAQAAHGWLCSASPLRGREAGLHETPTTPLGAARRGA